MSSQKSARQTLPEIPSTSNLPKLPRPRFLKQQDMLRAKAANAGRRNTAQAAVFRFDTGEVMTRAQIGERFGLNQPKVSRIVIKLRHQGLRVFKYAHFQQT